MTVDEMKKAACAVIDKHAEELLDLNMSIVKEPELGYKEFKTAKKIQAHLDKLGLSHRDNVAITGIITPLKGRDHKMNLSIMGELDAVIVPKHKYSDPVTGAAHCCGHSLQAVSVIGVAYALVEAGIMKELDGDITLMHVPAEEFVELMYRKSLIDEGKIKLCGGKQEFIRLGEFDHVDMMIMQHTLITENGEDMKKANAGGGTGLGFVGKVVNYKGKACHPAIAYKGINALKAAQVGLVAIDANRETFREEDRIKVHPIITKGGHLVNIVPDDVWVETYVRGNNTEAILHASDVVDRCFHAGADALGAQCDIYRLPGYMCPTECQELKDVAYENLKYVFGEEKCERNGEAVSTDAYDVAHLLPVVHMNIGGAKGVLHGEDFSVPGKDMALIGAAKVLACTAIDLLANGAEKGLHIKENFTPELTKEEYLKGWCGLS